MPLLHPARRSERPGEMVVTCALVFPSAFRPVPSSAPLPQAHLLNEINCLLTHSRPAALEGTRAGRTTELFQVGGC